MWGTVLICFISCVHIGYGQFTSHHQYDFPNLLQTIVSDMRTSHDLKNENNNPDLISTIEQFKNLFPFDFDSFKNFTPWVGPSKCKEDIDFLVKNIKSEEKWGIKMLDAFGKPDSGILEGKFKWLGDYHECTSIRVPRFENQIAGNFKGQYCSLAISLYVPNATLPLTVGICIPESCQDELDSITSVVSQNNPLKSVMNITSHICQPTSKKLSSAAIGFICLLGFFLLLSIIGTAMTVYEYFNKSDIPKDDCQGAEEDMKSNGGIENKGVYDSGSLTNLVSKDESAGWYSFCQPFFNCFCLITNGGRILNTEGSEGELLCLHGIRFLSMSWVILCHVYAFGFLIMGNLEAVSLTDSWLFQIVLNGFFSVDSFFVLSGFLLAYLFFKQAEKSNGKFPWVYAYVHRYIRLTFVYVIVLGIYTTLYYYFGSGPIWTTAEVEPICQKNWWYNLLYINNFVSSEKQCLGWAWYLANDMQFFWISPIFLVTLIKWPKIGISLLGLFLIASMCAIFGVTYHYNLFAGFGNLSNKGADIMEVQGWLAEFFDKFYIKPYCRIGPYLIGIALAYYMSQSKKSDKVKLKFIPLCCGWILSTAITLTSLFVLYDNDMTKVENGFYNALNHSLYAMSLAWVIFACLTDQAGPVNSILSFKLFIPLSRLTYCAYLIHPMFLLGYFSALNAPLQFAHMTMVTIFLGLLIVTYFFSFLLSIIFESPVIRLEKLLRSKFGKQ